MPIPKGFKLTEEQKKAMQEGRKKAKEARLNKKIEDNIVCSDISCSSFDKCSAPICPIDKNLNHAVFYPDDEICHNKQYSKEHWRKIQKKIQKKVINRETCYTYQDLIEIKRITPKTTGIDPDGRNIEA